MHDDWRQIADRAELDIETIKERLPLEWVVAVAAGINLVEAGEGRTKGLCPFHDDNDPSLDIYGYGERWGCFACPEKRGGDLFDFIGDYWELQGFPARIERAIELLKEYESDRSDWKGIIQTQVPPKPVTVEELGGEVQTSLGIVKRESTKPIEDLLSYKGLEDLKLDWLIRNWRLGVTAGGEVLAPYWNTEGKLVTYKTRTAGRGGWYARRGGKLTSLYGEWQLKGALAEAPVWLCEGETDTWLASWLLRGVGVALGLPSGAGSRIRDEWVELMRDRRVTLVMDSDKAGRAAAERWFQQLNRIAGEVAITFPESDLCDSRNPEKVLHTGKVVPPVSGFIVPDEVNGVYREVTQRGVGAELSNFLFDVSKRIEYRDTLGMPNMDGFEGRFVGEAGKLVRIKTTDMENAASMRKWASQYGRSWYGQSAKHPQAFQSVMQGYAPFLKEEIAVPVSGLWGADEGHSVFVLPRGSGGSLGSAIGRERWSFAEGMARYDIGGRYVLQRKPVDPQVLKSLLKLNIPGVTTPLIAWMMAAPLRSLVREFPPLAVLGGSGSGKTSLTLAVMKLLWGWQGAEQNLTNTTPYAAKQAFAASNGLPMWFDEYRRGARKDTFVAVGQVIRDAWTGSVSTRGGVGDDLSRIEVTAAIAPMVLSGEAGLEERSHKDRVIVVRLGREHRNPDALQHVVGDVEATGGGSVGRDIIEWQLERLDQQDPLVSLPPARMDRQEQGLAVLEWGWEMWQAWLYDRHEIRMEWDLDLSVVTAQRESEEDANPEISALWEALQLAATETYSDMVPVAWVVDGAMDRVAVRPRAFHVWAEKRGYVLPGGPSGTRSLLQDRYQLVTDRAWYVTPVNRKQMRADVLVGVLSHADQVGVDLRGEGAVHE